MSAEPAISDVLFFIFVLIVDCGLVFANVFFLALFSDLEADSINPIDMCRQVNTYIIPEIGVHAFITLLLLLTGSFIPFFLNLPLLIWNIYRWKDKKYLLDATQIFRDLPFQTKILFVKLGFYMVCFCVYLFYLIRSAIGAN